MLGQKKLFQRLVPGVMHALIFWGFLVLFPTIVMALVSAVNRDWSIPWLGAQGWFMALVDVFVLSVLAGIGMAVWIRRWCGRSASTVRTSERRTSSSR